MRDQHIDYIGPLPAREGCKHTLVGVDTESGPQFPLSPHKPDAPTRGLEKLSTIYV